MTSRNRFDELSAGLAAGVERHDGLVGIALLGSASDEGAARRDEWSDHDFFAVIAEGRGDQIRPDLTWLPDHDRVVLTAREGEIGFVAVYDDGHVLEFALAEARELAGALAGDATVLVDDPSGATARLIADARARAAAADGFDPANDARLVLVKLLIGVGRARRGETLVAGSLVRQWAVQHLVRALRGRFPERSTPQRDAIDPLRRFELDFASESAQIADAVARPVEEAAFMLFTLTRTWLETGWPQFPTDAADAVAHRLRWT